MREEQLLRRLQEGLAGLGLDARRCPTAAYLEYTAMLAKWNRVYNLTGVREREQMIVAHVLDSLSVLPYLKGNRCLDVGAGAGLPGFILALAQPGRQWSLLESNGRKVRFLRRLALAMKTDNVEIVHSRAERFQPAAGYSSIISRAFGSLAVFYGRIEHLARPGARILAMKGRMPAAELQAVAAFRENTQVAHLAVPGIAADRNLVIREVAAPAGEGAGDHAPRPQPAH